MSRVTYWVEYTFKCKYWDSEENDWLEDEDCDAKRFHCPKKDIKKNVEKSVREELSCEKIKDLVIEINDYYGRMRIVNLAGQVVKDVYVSGYIQLSLPKGIYIVVTENSSQKVIL